MPKISLSVREILIGDSCAPITVLNDNAAGMTELECSKILAAENHTHLIHRPEGLGTERSFGSQACEQAGENIYPCDTSGSPSVSTALV